MHPSRPSLTQRRHVVPALAMALSLGLAGCGDGSSDADSTPSTSTAAQRRAQALLDQMTLDEKIQLVHGTGLGQGPIGGAGYIPGIARLGIPDYIAADSATGVLQTRVGATGVSFDVNQSTPMPAPIAVAASWNPEVAREVGARIGLELRTLGFSEGLGGSVNLAREPRNGRTFENLGEDPVLAGLMIAARTQGTQSQNVVATIKHYAGNEQETNRSTADSVIDERTLRELYLLPFEIGIQDGQPGNVMCAYNKINGQKACESPYLLTDVLKTEWGYTGKVQSDWFVALTDTVRGATAGLDEEQAGSTDDSVGFFGVPSYFNQKLKAAVQAGTVSQARVDDMVRRKLYTMARVGLLDHPPTAASVIVDTAAGDAVARRAAQEAMVLLKNATPANASAPVLPLDAATVQRIVVIGGHADVAVLTGGGAAAASPRDGNPVTCLRPGYTVGNVDGCAIWLRSSPLAAIRAKAPGASVTYLDGSDAAAAASAAAAADVAIVFATQWQTETSDLPSLSLPDAAADPANQAYDQNALISAVSAAAAKTVVVLQTGTAVTMPWLSAVPAVLQAWYPGVQGGPAIADVLFGDVNPSGKLPLTFPQREADLPQTAISTDLHVPYSEGLAMGYRWFDSRSLIPLFAFGHGLSYTSFRYSSLTSAVQADGSVQVSFTLANTGSRAGAEVAQVYAGLPGSAGEPPRRLVGWQKLTLAAGESRVVTLTVAPKRLAVWDTAARGWRVPAGSFTFHVGGSSRDLLTQVAKLSVSGGAVAR